jgi:hypothetical protein
MTRLLRDSSLVAISFLLSSAVAGAQLSTAQHRLSRPALGQARRIDGRVALLRSAASVRAAALPCRMSHGVSGWELLRPCLEASLRRRLPELLIEGRQHDLRADRLLPGQRGCQLHGVKPA